MGRYLHLVQRSYHPFYPTRHSRVERNRIGYQQAGFSVAQLKIIQEVITLSVFVPFAVLYLNEPMKLDYLWAALCMVGAVYFIFRST